MVGLRKWGGSFTMSSVVLHDLMKEDTGIQFTMFRLARPEEADDRGIERDPRALISLYIV